MFVNILAPLLCFCAILINSEDVGVKIREALCQLECSHDGNDSCFIETNCDCTKNNQTSLDALKSQYDHKKPFLKCQNEEFLHVEWAKSDAKMAYFLHVLSPQKFYFTQITFCNYFSIEDILPNTTYEITLWSINNSNIFISEPLKIQSRTEETLLLPPQNLSVKLTPDFNNFQAEITWNPAEDLSCNYEIILFCTTPHNLNSGEMIPAPEIYEITDPADLYNLTIDELNFGYSYELTIRSKDSRMEKESENSTISFTTPTCLEIFKNIDECEPEQPKNVTIFEYLRANKNSYDIKLNWSRPEFEPDYYILRLNIINSNLNNSILNISGESINATFENIELSSYYQVYMQAISTGGASLPTIIDRLSVMKSHNIFESFNILLIIFGILGLVLILGLLIIPIKKQQMLTCENLSKHKNQYEKNQEKMENFNVANFKKAEKEEDKWEVPISDIKLVEKLGEGAFGIVWKATLKSEKPVACKMLKSNSSIEEKRQLEQEIEIMKYVGTHPNIVSMLGCILNTENIENGPILIVEYCEKGDLLSYLRNIYHSLTSHFNTPFNDSDEADSARNDCTNKMYDFEFNFGLQLSDAISFGRQIALGMEYLSNQKVLHRDLAARNILMCDEKRVKVSDFGLSRDVYMNSVYCKTTNGRLPVRWMALESLTHQVYTSQSDVWSFGIVMWEIFSLGAIPYPGVETHELLIRLKRGERMTKSQLCPDEMYSLMLNCWRENPNERPTFTALKATFEKLLGDQATYLELNEVECQEQV